jgi:isoquinoline 1-oxidoreductase alpha subunit
MRVTINGQNYEYDGAEEMPLLWFLRDEIGLMGTKYGCLVAACGSCTVHVNGEAVRSCQTPMSAVADQQVTTIEGLHPEGRHPVQIAWREVRVAQCGYCQTGQIMQAAALLKSTPRPTDDEIDAAMQGNLCRCGTYTRIRAAIKRASET